MMGLSTGTGVSLIMQIGGIGLVGSFISGALESRGSTQLASLVTIGTYAVMGALVLFQVWEFIDYTMDVFNL